MADKKTETSSTTLSTGTVVHGSKELIDRLSGGSSGGGSTSTSTTTRSRKTSADQ